MNAWARLRAFPLGGGTPREVLENVQDADWSADGESLAVVRFVPENQSLAAGIPHRTRAVGQHQLDEPSENFS